MTCCVDIVQDISGCAIDAIDLILSKAKVLPLGERLLPCQRLGKAYVQSVRQCNLVGLPSLIGYVVRNRDMEECFMSDGDGNISMASVAMGNVIAEVAPFAYLNRFRVLLLMRTPASVRRQEFEHYLNEMKRRCCLDVPDVQLRFTLKDGVVNSGVSKKLDFDVNFFCDFPPFDSKTVDIGETVRNINRVDEIKHVRLAPENVMGRAQSAVSEMFSGLMGNSYSGEGVSFLRSDVAETEFSDILAYPTMRYCSDKMPSLSKLVTDGAEMEHFFGGVAQYAIEKMNLKERYDAKA